MYLRPIAAPSILGLYAFAGSTLIVAAELARGGYGDDVLQSFEGADLLIAGAGADKLYGGPGDDAL